MMAKRSGMPQHAGLLGVIKWAALVASLLLTGQQVAMAATSQTRTSAFEYDDKGLLTKEIIEPTSSDLCVVTAYTYDSYGNRLTSTTRNCNGSVGKNTPVNDEAAAPTGVAVFTSRTTTYTYTDDARFVKTVTNALGHVETREYDSRFGGMTKLTGPNGLVTEWQYDGFGRKTLEIQSYAAGATTAMGTKWEYLYCSGVNGGTATCPSGIKGPDDQVGTGGSAKYVVVTTPVNINTATKTAGAANGPYSKTYYDELNRPIRTESQSNDASGTSKIVYKDTVYNNLGQVAYVSRPYVTTDSRVWEYTEYDLLGRITRAQFYDDQGVQQSNTMSYDGLSVSTTNAKSQKTTKVNNSQGQTESVTDANGKVLLYTYDAFGNLLTTAVQGKESITKNTLSYDLKGRKISMVDVDMGSWSYVYNALGELIKQTDAKSQDTSTSYDKLGRMIERREGDLVSNWYYDQYANRTACDKGIGKLCEASSTNGYNRKHTFDSLGRPSTSVNVIDSVSYTTSTSYDPVSGRVTGQTYPTGFATKFVYTALGFLKEVRKASDNTLYWQADITDAQGNLLKQTFGNGVQTLKSYNPYTGRLTGITAGANMGVLNLSYIYDSLGNVLTRQDANQNLTEAFTNDSLNRIKTASVNATATGMVTTNYEYDDLGNITCKSDLGACSATTANMAYNAWAYNAANQAVRQLPHAVASVTGTVHGALNPTYKYDLNGNMISGAGFTVSYTSYNMVSQITHASRDGVSYLYGSEHQRIREQILTAGTLAVKETTHYLHPDMANGLFFERQYIGTRNVSGSKYVDKFYLTAGGEAIAIVQTTSVLDATLKPVVTNNQVPTYLHRDSLGSVVAVTNEAGTVLARYAYDPFGKRRNPNGLTDPADALRADLTDRGFTNHEHLDALGLINMNGRFYDPALGRFMSADPYIQAPDNLQSYNRYSYTMNNPLCMVDPTGFNWLSKFWKRVVRPIVASVVGFMICGPECATAAFQGMRAYGQTGNPADFLRGAVNGYVGSTYGPNSLVATGTRVALACSGGGGGTCIRQAMTSEVRRQLIEGAESAALAELGVQDTSMQGGWCSSLVAGSGCGIRSQSTPSSRTIAHLIPAVVVVGEAVIETAVIASWGQRIFAFGRSAVALLKVGNLTLQEPDDAASGARTDPKDHQEELAIEEARGGAGEKYPGKLGDKKYDPVTGTKDKMTHNHDHGDGTSTEVHYDVDRATGKRSGFKIKDDTNARSRGYRYP
jgi:RHS repeat-associated protein